MLANAANAPAYAVVAVHAPNVPTGLVERVFRQFGGPGTLVGPASGDGLVLIPAAHLAEVWPRCERAHAQLTGPVWLGVTHRPVAELHAARDMAADIRTVAVTLLPPGVYQIRDVMVEYAAATTPGVAARLVDMIAPVMAQPILRETLEALILADGNRSRAAEQLIIHRSTIDYRLQRIEALTRQCPTSMRGLSILSTASVAYALQTRASAQAA